MHHLQDVPGQSGTGHPFVLGKNIFLSHCPFLWGQGEEQKVPGQTPLSMEVLGQKSLSPKNKQLEKTGKDVLKQEIIGKNSDCPIPSGVPSSVPSWISTEK